MPQPVPFAIHIPDTTLDDLRDRLGRTRWPPALHGEGWRLGTDRAYLQGLLAHWRDRFDWRTQETTLNGYPHFMADVGGALIHFVHLRAHGRAVGAVDSPPTAVLLLHGWPYSFAELLELADRLANPDRYGVESRDAFDVCVPSLPGFAFSGVPDRPFFWRDVPSMFAELMTILGYERFVAHGSDIGASITHRLAIEFPERLVGIHLTQTSVPEPGDKPLTDAEREMLAEDERWEKEDAAYTYVQETRPMTLAYGLTDSPAGLAGWIVEKLREWTDLTPDGDIERVWSTDRTLTLLTLYWATNTIATSFLAYFEPMHDDNPKPWHRPSVSTAIAMFPRGLSPAPREWAERGYDRLVQWTDMPRGGHFPAVETVNLLAEDIRSAISAFNQR